MARIIGMSPSRAMRTIQRCFICWLDLGKKRQGVDGGRISATVEFHGQLSACVAEIPQRKCEGDHLVELRRMDIVARPYLLDVCATIQQQGYHVTMPFLGRDK